MVPGATYSNSFNLSHISYVLLLPDLVPQDPVIVLGFFNSAATFPQKVFLEVWKPTRNSEELTFVRSGVNCQSKVTLRRYIGIKFNWSRFCGPLSG